MNHPNAETLTDFLYDELDSARQTEITAHLVECAECQTQVEAWRGVRRELKGWTLPPKTHALAMPDRSLGVVRWAAAAAIFLGAGFALAKLTQQPIDLGSLRAEIADEVRAEVSRDLSTQLAQELRKEVGQELSTTLAGYSEQQDERYSEFQQAMIQAVSRLEARQLVQHANLRKDVEIVALSAQQELNRLAVNDQADSPGVELQP